MQPNVMMTMTYQDDKKSITVTRFVTPEQAKCLDTKLVVIDWICEDMRRAISNSRKGD
jgi:hypothetical protein